MNETETVPSDDQVPVDWRQTPTILIDAAIGDVHVAGVHRVTFAEFVLNTEPDAKLPIVRPVITVALSGSALQHLADHFAKLVQKYYPETPADAE